jgi:hypothetical protein
MSVKNFLRSLKNSCIFIDKPPSGLIDGIRNGLHNLFVSFIGAIVGTILFNADIAAERYTKKMYFFGIMNIIISTMTYSSFYFTIGLIYTIFQFVAGIIIFLRNIFKNSKK